MEQNPSWEANGHSASHEIPRLLWNRVHKGPPLVPVLRDICTHLNKLQNLDVEV
jgi:hypothetical protein